VALTSRLQSFETKMLAAEQNFAGLAALNRALIGRAEKVESGWRTILDMDSTEVPVHGEHYGKPRVMVRDACNRRRFRRQSPRFL